MKKENRIRGDLEKATKSSFAEEFKEFALKGNVIDLAVGVVIGGAFSAIVNSLVNDLIMPIVGYLTAGMDFSDLKFAMSPEAAIFYGSFIQTVINFFIITLSIFFVVRIINKARRSSEAAEEKPASPSETDLLIQIRDLLKERSG